jgi:hypothetical protein
MMDLITGEEGLREVREEGFVSTVSVEVELS